MRERELKGRVPVASHAAAGGGQSNHAEVPRFNLCVCEREREKGEKRERAAADGASQAQSEREREMETRAAAAPLQQRMGQITRRVARLLRRRKRTPVEAAVAYSAAGTRSTKLLVLNQQK